MGIDISPSKQILQETMVETLKKAMPQIRERYESSLGLMMPVRLLAAFSLLITGLVLYILIRMGDKKQIGIYLIYKVVSFATMCYKLDFWLCRNVDWKVGGRFGSAS